MSDWRKEYCTEYHDPYVYLIRFGIRDMPLDGLIHIKGELTSEIKDRVEVSIDRIDLTVRAHNALRGHKIKHLHELKDWTRQQFAKTPNCGGKTLGEIEIIMKRKNVQFKKEDG